jgi:K+-sensing histidine kinase KdpD
MFLRYPVVFAIGLLAGFFLPKLIRALFDNDLIGILSQCIASELRNRLPQGIGGLWKSWASWGGAAVCEVSAAGICYLFQGSTHDSIVPLGFLVIVVACARHFGALAGVLGSLSAAVTFAVFLFAPVGRLAVSDISARVALTVLVIGGIALSCFLPSGGTEKRAAAAGASR